MLSFIICFALLIGGYFVYGKIVENTFAPDDRETPESGLMTESTMWLCHSGNCFWYSF